MEIITLQRPSRMLSAGTISKSVKNDLEITHSIGGMMVFRRVAQRLKSSAVEVYPAFDRRALPSYLTLLVGAALTTGFVVFGDFRFVDPFMLLPPTWAGLLLVAGLLARRYGHTKIGGSCESVALVYSQSLIMLASLPMITAFSAPLADGILARADRVLGFDWKSYAALFRDSKAALRLICISYMSFTWEAGIILIALMSTDHSERAWQFVAAAAFALLITVAVYPFAPAYGAFVHFGITREMYPNLPTGTPWSFAPAIHTMKSGNHLINDALMVGYVSFPSYHAASAVLFSWASWPLGRVRWFFVVVNFAMAGSAMIVGAHYLVDLIGGTVVAVVSIVIACRLAAVCQNDGEAAKV